MALNQQNVWEGGAHLTTSVKHLPQNFSSHYKNVVICESIYGQFLLYFILYIYLLFYFIKTRPIHNIRFSEQSYLPKYNSSDFFHNLTLCT